MPAPRNFSFNPAAKLATTRIYDENDYELIVGEPKVFYNEGNEEAGKKETYGILYPLTIAEGEYKGEKYIHNLWIHSDNAAGMIKQFQMVGLGYQLDADSEVRFNAEHGGAEGWEIDFEEKTCGEKWHALTGHRVGVHFKVGVNKQNQQPQQQITKMWPVA